MAVYKSLNNLVGRRNMSINSLLRAVRYDLVNKFRSQLDFIMFILKINYVGNISLTFYLK